MRAPCPGFAASVVAIRSASSALDVMPFADSRSRTAASSFSPSVSRMFMRDLGRLPDPPASWRGLTRPSCRLQPMFVDLDQQFIAGVALLPDGGLVKPDVIER